MTFKNQYGIINISNEVIHQIINHYIKKCFGVKKIKYRSFLQYNFLNSKTNIKNGIQIKENIYQNLSITIFIYVQYGINIYELCKSIIKEVKYEINEITSINLKNIDIIIENINN